MESDGKTRLYSTSRGGDAWLHLPTEEHTGREHRLVNEAAQEVLGRADYRCVSIGAGSAWSCEDKTTGESFDVPAPAESITYRSKEALVEALETRAGRTGLTIVVS